jgi:large subunit ribosomal protein L18
VSTSTKSSAELRARRHARVRRKLSGTAERPRLAVFRSTNHIYAQLIDDLAGRTLVSASTVADGKDGSKTQSSEKVGRLIAERAKAAGVENVVFDRGGFRFHGRVAAVANAARNAGLKF